jgi:hypothetical protein
VIYFSEYPQNGAYCIVWEGYGGHVVKESEDLYSAYYHGSLIGTEESLDLARALVVQTSGENL